MNCFKKNTECFMYVIEPVASVLVEMNRSKSDNFCFCTEVHLRHYLKNSGKKRWLLCVLFILAIINNKLYAGLFTVESSTVSETNFWIFDGQRQYDCCTWSIASQRSQNTLQVKRKTNPNFESQTCLLGYKA